MEIKDNMMVVGQERIALLEDRVTSVIKGKPEAIRLAIASLLARGHLLIEDVPGVGKTTLAYTMAQAIDCSFHRIQFTSDLMPSDIVGVSIYNRSSGEFEFREGPIFANIVLADEINRTTPKTQSALLEAMNEKRVTVERITYELPSPFMVIATQNPLEHRGTFPLPESQLDRFSVYMMMGYPSGEHEKAALMDNVDLDVISSMPPVVTATDIIALQEATARVRVEESVLDYIMQITTMSREYEDIRLGVSTRGAQHLLRVSRAMAFCAGRDFVTPGDIKSVAPNVMAHRVLLRRQGSIADAASVVSTMIEKIPVPL